jgi:16S rRNA (guanine527-N7)-methyltransferase
MHNDTNNQFKAMLAAAIASFKLDALSEMQVNHLAQHYAMLRVWNKRTNLTRIIEPEEAARLHYADSLFGGQFIEAASTLIDLGSGAGFPAIPLAVLRPDVQVTAIEANHKKALFLREAKDALRLANFSVVDTRLEAFELTGFDLVTSRALDRAEAVLPAVIERLRAPQRFMLYGAPDLLAKLANRFPAGYRIERHSIPESESRLIAIFARE